MTGIQNENILLFDPYYWDKPFEQKDILMDDKHPKEYNRIVPFQYFNQENKEIIYALDVYKRQFHSCFSMLTSAQMP